jgi:hypothetical protein
LCTIYAGAEARDYRENELLHVLKAHCALHGGITGLPG